MRLLYPWVIATLSNASTILQDSQSRITVSTEGLSQGPEDDLEQTSSKNSATAKLNKTYRNALIGPTAPLMTSPEDFNGTSTYELFKHGMKLRESTPELKSEGAFGAYGEDGKYGWISYEEMDEWSRLTGNGIVNLHLDGPILDKDGKEWRMIGIYSEHRIGWTITELAASRQNITLVPIYDTGDESFVRSILEQTQIKSLIVSSKNAKRIMDLILKKEAGALENVIIIGDIFDKLMPKRCAQGLKRI